MNMVYAVCDYLFPIDVYSDYFGNACIHFLGGPTTTDTF